MEGEKRLRHDDTERTPGWLRDFVDTMFAITFEPEHQLQHPLEQPWQGFSFVHPPHAEAELWCKKAAAEAKEGRFSVLLLPAVFNSCYWREIVYKQATDIRVFTCPVKMPGAKKQIVSQMCLIVFAGTDNRAEDYHYPPVYPIEPEGWIDHYYKRPRNRARFATE